MTSTSSLGISCLGQQKKLQLLGLFERAETLLCGVPWNGDSAAVSGPLL